MIYSRYYTIEGVKWEASFFNKGEAFPDTDLKAPKQGVWAHEADEDWQRACYLGISWQSVNLDAAVRYFPTKK